MNDELMFVHQSLELELELPWLTAEHDDHKVRVSGLTNDLDPEKLKFYLSALADNVVTDIYFDETQSRAVAIFSHSLGKLLWLPALVHHIREAQRVCSSSCGDDLVNVYMSTLV